MAKILADASPEKRLFISLLTRDIPLIAAFLDLIDNSINSVVEPFAGKLRTADDYLRVFGDKKIVPSVAIALNFSADRIEVIDTASGISAEAAEHRVFKFGRPDEPARNQSDRLSVYGIGLKRAMFKLGNNVRMRSEHKLGGFDLHLDVSEWEKKPDPPWTFAIEGRTPKKNGTGTAIVVTELYDDVRRRLLDGVFEGELRDAIAKTYSYYLTKFVAIYVNGTLVEGVSLEIGKNHSSKKFVFGDVSCAITAGIGVPEGGKFRDKSSGWFVFCNGRAVVSSDKTQLTGWGGSTLPLFQPKHRPFLGTVFFVSEDPEQLPWTTTKSAINEDSLIWQTAKRQMGDLGRIVISFLDGRYTDEGTEVASKDLQEAAGGDGRVSVLSVAVSQAQSFKNPVASKAATVMRIQYDAKISEIRKIASYLKKPGISGSDVGRHTFSYFLRNEVGED